MSATDVLTAGKLLDQLSEVGEDELRALSGRLEDAQRIVRAVLRERLALARRNTTWAAREKVAGVG